MRKVEWVAALAALTVGACSGGGAGNAVGGGGTANSPPVFSSAGAASVIENTAGTVYTATATDADGNAVSFSIAGGADAARFAISAAGALSFAAPPNFDLPGDANASNVYQVTIAASDGRATTTQSVAITVTNSKEGVSVQRISTGFVDPVAASVVPGTRRLIVVQRNGDIFEVDGATGNISAQGNLFSGFGPSPGAKVLSAIAVPTYATTPSVIMALQYADGRIIMYRAIKNAATWVSNSILLNTPATASDENTVAFAYSDSTTLYAAITDGSGTTQSNAAQSSGTLLGKLVKITPDPDPFAGASPNYFIVQQVGSGVHQPTGASVVSGDLLFGDRGATAFEEVDRLTLPGTSANFGWPFKEGTQAIANNPPGGLTDPALQYAHGTGLRQGAGVVAGQAYAGAVGSLANMYVFSDRNGTVFAVPLAKLRSGTLVTSADIEVRSLDFAANAGAISAPVGFISDGSGFLYVIDGDGELFRVDGA